MMPLNALLDGRLFSALIRLLLNIFSDIVLVNPTKGKWTFNKDSLDDAPVLNELLALLFGGRSSSMSKLEVSSGPETVG